MDETVAPPSTSVAPLDHAMEEEPSPSVNEDEPLPDLDPPMKDEDIVWRARPMAVCARDRAAEWDEELQKIFELEPRPGEAPLRSESERASAEPKEWYARADGSHRPKGYWQHFRWEPNYRTKEPRDCFLLEGTSKSSKSSKLGDEIVENWAAYPHTSDSARWWDYERNRFILLPARTREFRGEHFLKPHLFISANDVGRDVGNIQNYPVRRVWLADFEG